MVKCLAVELSTECLLGNLCVIHINDVPSPAAKLVCCWYTILYWEPCIDSDSSVNCLWQIQNALGYIHATLYPPAQEYTQLLNRSDNRKHHM